MCYIMVMFSIKKWLRTDRQIDRQTENARKKKYLQIRLKSAHNKKGKNK